MTIEQDLTDALGTLFDGKVFPDIADIKTAPPYCVYILNGGIDQSTFCGPSTPANIVVQFWVWGKTRESANTLMRSVGAIVTASPFYAVSQGGFFSQYDDITKLRGAFQDFSFWR